MLSSDYAFHKSCCPFDLQFTLLKYDPNLATPQSTHIDNKPAHTVKSRNKSNFAAIIGVEHQTFLGIKLAGAINHERMLIERGDVMLVRNDISHRGCENLTDYEYFRVHFL